MRGDAQQDCSQVRLAACAVGCLCSWLLAQLASSAWVGVAGRLLVARLGREGGEHLARLAQRRCRHEAVGGSCGIQRAKSGH